MIVCVEIAAVQTFTLSMMSKLRPHLFTGLQLHVRLLSELYRPIDQDLWLIVLLYTKMFPLSQSFSGEYPTSC